MALLTRRRELPPRPSFNGNGAWGTSHDGKRQQRALLASATQLMGSTGLNRPEAARLNKLRQPWQEDAWAYRDAIGELRYATTYLGNASRKVVLVPSAYVPGELDPQPLSEIPDCPDSVKIAADDAILRLSSGGPLAMSGLQRDLTENFEVAGECFLVGWPPGKQLPELDNPEEVWEIRSISELTSTNDGRMQLRVEGAQPQDIPDGTFVQRLWYPHPRRKSLADSPFAAMLDVCEELLILSRDVRAAGRSRLANSGLLLIPDRLTVVKSNMQEDANDNQKDDFMEELIQAGMAAIQDEGSASAIFPIIVRGPKDELSAVRQLQISRPEAQRASDRQELLSRMATTLDLPAEVLTGKGDLNHWTAWSVSEDTFNDHIEPLVMVMDDAITAGYFRLAMTQTPDIDQDWARRAIIWHDATRLVRHPDRSQDALQAYDRLALSDEALRDTMGFSSADAPTNDELLIRLLVRQNRLDPTIVAQIIKRMDESIDITAIKPDQQVADPGAADANPGGPDQAGGHASPAPQPQSQSEGAPQGGQPGVDQPSSPVPPPISIAAAVAVGPTKASIQRGNRQFSKIERELTDKLSTAANAHMTRALEKAGARIRTTVGRTASGRAWCAGNSNIHLCFLISNSMIAAAGLDEQMLLNDAWNQLKLEYDQYVEYADKRTIDSMASMLKMDSDQFQHLAAQLVNYRDAGWNYLHHQLQRTAMGYLSDSASVLEEDIGGDIITTRLVQPSVIKETLARVGGHLLHSADQQLFDPTVSVRVPQTGLTTGPAVSDELRSNGLSIESYTWVHGFTPSPFDPHLELDGVEFTSWTDSILANDGDFPDGDFFIPGDHDGCSCDFSINWSDQESIAAAGQPLEQVSELGGQQ
jgi:hypothetical protein